MAKPTREDALLAQRYEAAVRLARDFMTRVRLTQTGLAELLEANPSTLSRFLSGDPQALPALDRPGKLELLARIEERCSVLSVVRHAPLVLPDDLTDDDASLALGLQAELQAWFEEFEELNALQGLTGAGRLVALVANAPRRFRTALCGTALLYMGVLALRPSVQHANVESLRRTIARARRLESAGKECLNEATSCAAREDGMHKLTGYAGLALCACAMRIPDEDVIEEGLARLQSVAPSARFVHGHWQNLFQVIEQLLSDGSVVGKSAAAGTAGMIQELPDSSTAKHVLLVRHYPLLMQAWEHVAPELAARMLKEREAAGE